MSHYFRVVVLPVLACAAVLLVENGAQSARAQDSGRSSRSDGGGRDSRGRYRGGFGDRSRRSRDDERRSEDRSSSGSNSSSNSSGSSSSSRPTTPTSVPPSTAGTQPVSSSSSTTGGMNMTDYAKKLVTKYDKNGDMMLQPEERKELSGRAADSDLNHDGVITVPELVTHLSDPSPSSNTQMSGGESSRWGSYGRHRDGDGNSSDRSKSDADKGLAGRVFTGTAGGGSGSTTKQNDKRRSYRFSTAADKDPGLPSELRSRDKNHDGQISMSEFSSYWNDRMVDDFRRWDLNNDGMITAKEAAKRK